MYLLKKITSKSILTVCSHDSLSIDNIPGLNIAQEKYNKKRRTQNSCQYDDKKKNPRVFVIIFEMNKSGVEELILSNRF